MVRTLQFILKSIKGYCMTSFSFSIDRSGFYNENEICKQTSEQRNQLRGFFHGSGER